ncbi:uncharacterized protein PAC_15072 [Phialocephala subalpina]|uniref:Uncharacterized protein n=1 Tax=Phialocephala subalpina TaxID=576137 RepID=A0A1L7XJE7_9HELO|nr:uncharacterized protein PAC_15072 [Phialocephala subalpina]
MPINNLWGSLTRNAASSQQVAPPTAPAPTSSSTTGEGNSCSGISMKYSCGHTWIEHARECVIGTVSHCPAVAAESMHPDFACLICGPPGSDNPTPEMILQVRTLGPEFGYWINSLIKDKNDALQKIEDDKAEMLKLRKETAELKTAVERLKKVEAESKKMVEAMEKHQVKGLTPFSGKMAPPPLPIKGQGQGSTRPAPRRAPSNKQAQVPTISAPTKAVPGSEAQGLAVQVPVRKVQFPEDPGVPIPTIANSSSQSQIQRKWSFGRPEGALAGFDDIEVLQQFEDCDHSDRIFFAKRGKPNPVVEKAIIADKKAGLCTKCIKFINSSQKEKVEAVEKELQTNFDKEIDDFYDRPQPLKRTNSGRVKKVKAHNEGQLRGKGGRFVTSAFVTDSAPTTPKAQINAASSPTTPQAKSNTASLPGTPMSTSMITYEPSDSRIKAKEIVEMFFAEPFQEIVDDLKTRQKEMVDTNYGIFVLDNVAAMELALRMGDERKFLVKKNELLRNRKDIERDLEKSSDIFGEDILKETQDCLQVWIEETDIWKDGLLPLPQSRQVDE